MPPVALVVYFSAAVKSVIFFVFLDGSLYEICSGLGLSGRRVAALSTVLPLALEKNQFVVDMLSRSERMNLVSLLPGCQQAETDVQ